MKTEYWRSLDGVPVEPGELDAPSRRDFLALLGSTAALAGVSGCFANPPDKVRPYAVSPEGVVPGNPLHYATSLTLDGYATGVIVASMDGRPIKVEGNPVHPASLGGTSAFEQAAIYQLLDPQRARGLKHRGRPRAWTQFLGDVASRQLGDGARLRFLVEPNGSPLEADLRAQILRRHPQAKFYAWAPLPQDAIYEGTRLLFGRPLEPQLDFDKARVILSLDADFLGEGPFRLRHARRFADHRVPENQLNRLYVAEPGFSLTGASADHRLRVRGADIEGLARAIFVALDSPSNDRWIKAVVADLKRSPALVVAGRRQPAAVHALTAAINARLASPAVTYTRPVLSDVAAGPAALAPLAAEIRAGAVDTLVITAYNPVYTAPADLGLEQLCARVPNLIYRGMFDDETARCAGWFLPATHELEAWGDARAADGTISFQQPLITPLWNGVTASEVLAAFLGKADPSYLLLRNFWASQQKDPDWWAHTVQNGLVADSAFAVETVTPDFAALAKLPAATAATGLEIAFRADARIHDGRFADNAWLQELPDPLSKLTWSNALEVSPATASRLGLATESLVRIRVAGKSVDAPVVVLPGHADDSLSLSLGYGRAGAEMIGRELGANANKLRTSQSWFAAGVTLEPIGKRLLSITQEHARMEERPIALSRNVGDLPPKRLPLVEETLYPEHPYDGYRWAMAIDMSRCTGCSTCIVACESENNILVVGAEQVRKSREMHWLRIDRYFRGSENDPEAVMQPLACVHCENAPCEYVCPVNATVHSDEGLNEMVYNRCVGTRYCSNNCPYKVRRFNFLNWHNNLQGTEEMAMNPDVSVRARGVMEKCTYCVQRIERARIHTRIEGRSITENDFTTACAQACPSGAIVFGSLHDPDSRVSKLHQERRSYRVLESLGTRPRTVHLIKVRNPNPELA